MEERSDRQHWEEGDVQVTQGQCNNCIHNDLEIERGCSVFGEKPNVYQFGTSVCTSKKVAER